MDAQALAVAAIQIMCQLGDWKGNLAKAAKYVGQAAMQGAKLVLLPELMPGGYTLNDVIWNTGNLLVARRRIGCGNYPKGSALYLGTSFLEAGGEDFFDTFVLTDPDGEADGDFDGDGQQGSPAEVHITRRLPAAGRGVSGLQHDCGQ